MIGIKVCGVVIDKIRFDGMVLLFMLLIFLCSWMYFLFLLIYKKKFFKFK